MSHNARRHHRRNTSAVELLEVRALLTSGIAWTDAPNLTLSFVPDGTDVAGHESRLQEVMDSVGARNQWRVAMRQGFEAWMNQIDADITVVEDDGQSVGTPGRPYDDPRFGDIRISAIPINQDTYAMSIAHDEFVAGTWAGDIILNSNAEFDSIDDIHRIVLHEAGHVLGLDHSDDPDSPMFEHGIPASTEPTEADIEALQEIYGFKKEDGEDDREQQESDDDDDANDEMETAVVLNPTDGFPKRRYTLEGSIRETTDVDIYKFQGYEDIDTELEVTTFVLRSTEPGKLIPRISILDSEGDVIDKIEVLQNGSGSVVIQTEEIDPEDDYFIKIEADTSDPTLGAGDYHLTISSRAEEIEPREFTEGTLKESEREDVHSIYLARAQLISLSLLVEPEAALTDTTVGIALFDHKGDLITTSSTGVGEIRSLDSLLLRAGTYYVSVQAESAAAIPEVEYKLLAISSTKEAGPLPTDPTGDPAFPCNDGTPDFCYPDGHRSSDPTHTNPGTGDNPPELDPYAILLSWLSWWPDSNSNAGWVDPQNDDFTVVEGSTTSLNVLLNDTGAAEIEVRSVDQPANGSVSIGADGNIQYSAASGVTGTEEFTYSIGAKQAFVDTTLATGDAFGSSVATFGNLALIGAPYSDHAHADSGAAYLFRRVSGDWVLEQTLTASDAAAGDHFGADVAIDGTTIVVSATHDDDLGTNSGSVYVFDFDPVTREYTESLKVNDPRGKTTDRFGGSIAIDGNTMVIGAKLDDGLGRNSGSAFIFHRNKGGLGKWGLRKKLKASTAKAFSHFGSSVDIDGEFVVVGASGDDVTAKNAGGAYVFGRHEGGTNNWGEVTRLSPTGNAEADRFGFDVAISGTSIVVGSPMNDLAAKNSGAGYVFEKDQGGADQWGETDRFTGDSAGDRSGASVAIDGDLLAFASPTADGELKNSGRTSLYVYTATGAWAFDYDITADSPAGGDQLGLDVAISNGTVILGAPKSDAWGTRSGHFVVEDSRRATANVSIDIGAALRATTVGDGAGVMPMVSQGQLAAQLHQAFEAWQAEPPADASIRFADLDGDLLGLTVGNRILIDVNAAGHGWFIDDNSRTGMSLATVVAHEVGHVLGLEDIHDETEHSSIMHAQLSPGQSRAVVQAHSDSDALFAKQHDIDGLFCLTEN
ncbi:MAG: matrixin family metalloprotease [Planctomycetaceae bacterium]